MILGNVTIILTTCFTIDRNCCTGQIQANSDRLKLYEDITDLPPQMGLLTRLWNLNTVGCSLQEPLRSVVRGGRCRSVDVVGYLRSVLQEAKPYARMKLMVVGVQ
ncbi:jg13050, partial [Pararge aegeria aegeria]